MNDSEKRQRSAGATDPGQRSHNEDAYLNDETLDLYLVADGVGGRDAGEVASRLACQTIRARSLLNESLPEAISAAHHVIREAATTSERSSSMAATVVALRVNGDQFNVAWSGDSRAYLWDGTRLLGLTRDHSLIEALIARGEISREEAANHPRKNVILAAIGGESAEPEVGENDGTLGGDATFLLCSDGLTDVLTPAQLCAALAEDIDLQAQADKLLREAKEAGGRDNITIVLMRTRAEAEQVSARSIYGAYDAASGEQSWPEPVGTAERPPLIQRVKGRRAETIGDTSVAGKSKTPPQYTRREMAPWLLMIGLLCALAIAGLVISRLKTFL